MIAQGNHDDVVAHVKNAKIQRFTHHWGKGAYTSRDLVIALTDDKPQQNDLHATFALPFGSLLQITWTEPGWDAGVTEPREIRIGNVDALIEWLIAQKNAT